MMRNQEVSELIKRITSNPGIFNGKPIIRGLRFPVKDVLELLADGMTPNAIIKEHPILEKEDIKAALLYAAMCINNTRLTNAA